MNTVNRCAVAILVVLVLTSASVGSAPLDGCRQGHTPNLSESLADRLDHASRLWNEHHCYQQAEIELTEVANLSRSQGHRNIELSSLLVLADLFQYKVREDEHEQVASRLQELLTPSANDEQRLQVELVIIDQLLMKRRYAEAYRLIASLPESDAAQRSPPELRARLHIARAHIYQRLGLQRHGEKCIADVVSAMEILARLPKNEALLGEAYWRLGRCEESSSSAFPHYDQGLILCRKAGNFRCLQKIHNSYAIRLRQAGRYQEAMHHYQEALVISRKYGFHAATAMLLGNLASLYLVMGQTESALVALQESIPLTRRYGTRYSISYRLETLGRVFVEMGRPESALEAFAEAIAIRKQAGYLYDAVIVAASMGETFLALGRIEEAVALLQQTKLEAQEALNGRAFARSVVALSRANVVDELELITAADIARFLGDIELEWNARYMLAYHAKKQSNLELAIFHGKQAVNLFQKVRSYNAGMERRAQKDLLARGERMYKDLADWLIERGRLPEAQQILAMLKEDEYFEFVRGDTRAYSWKTQADLTANESAASARIQQSGNELFRLATRVRELEKRQESEPLSDIERLELRGLRAQLREANAAFVRTVDELRQMFGRHEDETRRKEQEKRLIEQNHGETLRLLGSNVALVQTVTLSDHLAILLTTDRVSRAYRVALGEKDLNRRVANFLEVLRDPRKEPRQAGKALYEILIAPMQEDLQQSGIRNLMFSLDGALRYVPMAALHDGSHYLVENYTVSLFNEAAKTGITVPSKPRWRVAGLGVSKEIEGFSKLPAVVDELHAISGKTGVLPGTVHLDEAFDRDTLYDVVEHGYSIIHIASHFVFKPGNELDSFLLLGRGPRLTLKEFRENVFLSGVDLLTLSACETAVGGKGSEVEGLAVTAQLRGARAVLVTLWPVADHSTSHLMQTFYRQREEGKLTKAEALRQAQLALLTGKVGAGGTATEAERGAKRSDGNTAASFTQDPAAPYAHPYFWAPFILMGNWL